MYVSITPTSTVYHLPYSSQQMKIKVSVLVIKADWKEFAFLKFIKFSFMEK